MKTITFILPPHYMDHLPRALNSRTTFTSNGVRVSARYTGHRNLYLTVGTDDWGNRRLSNWLRYALPKRRLQRFLCASGAPAAAFALDGAVELIEHESILMNEVVLELQAPQRLLAPVTHEVVMSEWAGSHQ